MANIAYGPASPTATQGASTQKHPAATKGGLGGANFAYGPHGDTASEGGRLQGSPRITAPTDVNMDMQTDASAQALAAIRKMRLASATDQVWSSNFASARKTIG